MIEEGAAINYHRWLIKRISEKEKEKKESHEAGENEIYKRCTIEGAALEAAMDAFEEAMGWK